MQITWLNNWVSNFFSVLCNQQQLIVKFQVPHCCFSFSHYTQCSLTVSSAVARQVTSCSLDSTREQNGTSLWVSSIALELFSRTPVRPLFITGCCLASQRLLCPPSPRKVDLHVAKTCCLGRERHCDDQATEAHSSNAHLVAKERSLSFWSYTVTKTSIKQ